MRWYEINCYYGTSATPCIFGCWAGGCVEAFEIAKAHGYWPSSIAGSSFERAVVKLKAEQTEAVT